MVNSINFGDRNRPSVHNNRANLDARYHNQAMQRAMFESSIFCQPRGTYTYNYDGGSDFMTGQIFGNITNGLFNNLPGMIDMGKNIWAKLFG